METVLYFWNHWSEILAGWSSVVQSFANFMLTVIALASIIARFTSTPKDDQALAWLLNWAHQLSIVNAKDVKGIGQQPVPPQKTELPTKKG